MNSSSGNNETAEENGVSKDRNGEQDETSEQEAQQEGSGKYLKLSYQIPSEAQKYSPLYYKDLVFLRESVLEVEDIEKMEIRHDDILVCSFPRSGTTMTQELVYLIRTLDFDKANTILLDARFPIIDLIIEGQPFYGGLKMIENFPPPRFVKSHLHHFMLPEQPRAGKVKIIYTARNLPDTL